MKRIFNTWWRGISKRERTAVATVAVVSSLTLAWLAVVEPLQGHRARLEQRVPEQRALLAWMESVAGQVPRQPAAGASSTDQSLFAVIDSSVRATPLAGAVQRLQPEGESSVRVWLDDAAFNDLVRWLAALERDHGITPSALSIDRAGSAGLVNARLTLDILAR